MKLILGLSKSRLQTAFCLFFKIVFWMIKVYRLLIYCHRIKLQHGSVNITVYERRYWLHWKKERLSGMHESLKYKERMQFGTLGKKMRQQQQKSIKKFPQKTNKKPTALCSPGRQSLYRGMFSFTIVLCWPPARRATLVQMHQLLVIGCNLTLTHTDGLSYIIFRIVLLPLAICW